LKSLKFEEDKNIIKNHSFKLSNQVFEEKIASPGIPGVEKNPAKIIV